MRFFKHYLLALLVFNLFACSSMQPVSIETAMRSSKPAGVDIGSMVSVKTLDKKSHQFRVTEINPEGIGGATGFIPYAEMNSLKVDNPRYKAAKQKEAGMILLGILAVAGAIFLIGNADHVRVCSPEPCPHP